MVDLSVEIAGIKLKNPTILAAGILGTTGESLKRVARAGAGAVTTKSIGLVPREGHPNPTVHETYKGLLNCMGLPNPGAENFLEELKVAKEGGVPVIASIFGFNTKEFVEVAKIISRGNPDMIELNISCPNVEKGMIFGKDPKLAVEVTRNVKKVVDVPVIVKLTPNTDKLIEVAKAVEKAGADAISAVNTFGPGMVIDIETATPVLSNVTGGLSGPAIKPLALKHVYELSDEVKIPIIGMGGIVTGEDAIEFLMAGASAVGIGTGIMYEGLEVFKKVCDGLRDFMLRKNYNSLSEIIGLAKGR